MVNTKGNAQLYSPLSNSEFSLNFDVLLTQICYGEKLDDLKSVTDQNNFCLLGSLLLAVKEYKDMI